MEFLVMIGQLVLSLGLAVLMGSFILLAIPESKRPKIQITPVIISTSLLGVVLGAFIPILQITFALMPRMSFTTALETVLLSYRTGMAWDVTLGSAMILLIIYVFSYSSPSKIWPFIYLLLVTILIATIAWASHASSISPVRGFLGDFFHLLAAATWVGILLVIGWFSTNTANWLKWLKWFSPVAFSCFVVMGLSGFLLMDLTIPNYVEGLQTAYGKGLLLKHILMIPLIATIIINSFYMKRWLQTKAVNPTFWVRIESIVLFAIFAVTAFFSHQAPPM